MSKLEVVCFFSSLFPHAVPSAQRWKNKVKHLTSAAYPLLCRLHPRRQDDDHDDHNHNCATTLGPPPSPLASCLRLLLSHCRRHQGLPPSSQPSLPPVAAARCPPIVANSPSELLYKWCFPKRPAHWLFRWLTLRHKKYLIKPKKSIREMVWENAIAYSQHYSWMIFLGGSVTADHKKISFFWCNVRCTIFNSWPL